MINQSSLVDQKEVRLTDSDSNKSSSPTSNHSVVEKAKWFIGTWDDADLFMRDNEYIKTGYRINFGTAGRIIRSLFMCHNESANIWSHLCGVILFILLIVYVAIWILPDDVLKGYTWSVIPGDKSPDQATNVTYYI